MYCHLHKELGGLLMPLQMKRNLGVRAIPIIQVARQKPREMICQIHRQGSADVTDNAYCTTFNRSDVTKRAILRLNMYVKIWSDYMSQWIFQCWPSHIYVPACLSPIRKKSNRYTTRRLSVLRRWKPGWVLLRFKHTVSCNCCGQKQKFWVCMCEKTRVYLWQ